MDDVVAADGLLRIRDIAQRLNLHWKTVQRYVARKDWMRVPKPYLDRPLRWRESDWDAWIRRPRLRRFD